MQITITDRDENNLATITLETDPGRAKIAYSKIVKKIGNTVNIKGFRKGKVPVGMIEEYYGPANLRAETLNNDFLSELLNEAFNLQAINVVNIESIDKVEFENPDDKVLIEAKIELFPEVKLPEYKSLSLKVKVPKLDKEKQFSETLERLTLQSTEYAESTEAASMGDEIIFDFEGKFQKADGEWEAKEGMKAENYQSIVESGKFIENFLEQTVDMKAGESKEIDVKFPDQYFDEDLAGKPAKFTVKIHKVSKPTKPQMDSEFALRYGFETIEDLYAKIREEADKYSEAQKKHFTADAILSELHANSEVKLSKNMIDREIEHNAAVLQYQRNWTDEETKAYLEKLDRDQEEKTTREKLERSVIITTIIKTEKLAVTEDEIRSELGKINLPPDIDKSKIDYPAMIQRLNIDLLSEKAIALLIDNAKIDYEEVDESELPHVHGPNCGHSH